MTLQFAAVGTKRVGLDDICSRVGIFLVDATNELWIRDAQVLVAGVDEHPLGVNHSAHRPVEDERVFLELFEYGFHRSVAFLFWQVLANSKLGFQIVRKWV
jgi:hypothetical protein